MHNETKARTKFDESFKQEAINHWQQSGKSAPEVAAELGILPNRLYCWRKKLTPGRSLKAQLSMAELEAQNAQLRSENERLRQQRDILKKTLGILSEPPSNATNASKP